MHPNPLHHPDYAILIRLLKESRKQAGITQVELAKRLKVEQSLVSKVERQERRIDPAELNRICRALNIPLATFIARFETALKTDKALAKHHIDTPSF